MMHYVPKSWKSCVLFTYGFNVNIKNIKEKTIQAKFGHITYKILNAVIDAEPTFKSSGLT